MIDTALKLAIVIMVPVAGAMGYVHGTFSTIERVRKVETRVSKTETMFSRVDKLICKMAIRQKLDSAEEICTTTTTR